MSFLRLELDTALITKAPSTESQIYMKILSYCRSETPGSSILLSSPHALCYLLPVTPLPHSIFFFIQISGFDKLTYKGPLSYSKLCLIKIDLVL